jgi:hypothetical protein
MMKEKMRAVMAVALGLFIAGNGWALPFWTVSIDTYEWLTDVIKYDNTLLFVDYVIERYSVLPDSYYYIDSDGYSHLKAYRYVAPNGYTHGYPLGPVEKSGHKNGDGITIIPGALHEYAFVSDYGIITEIEDHYKDYYTQLKWGVADVSSSPFLKETIGGKPVEYEPKNLFMRFLGMQPRGSSREYWDATQVPWAEGEAGPGIGANITVNFKEPVDAISVLNGYVDIEKRHLYRQNNRVAVLKVIDLDNNKEYEMEFEDIVYYNALEFEKATRNIKLVIMSVYPGTKYDDTCITQIRYSLQRRGIVDKEEDIKTTVLKKYKKVENMLDEYKNLREILEERDRMRRSSGR